MHIAQCLNPSASSKCRWNFSEIVSLIQDERQNNHSFPFLAVTESRLKSNILDSQLHIPCYVVSRSDRGKRIGGGVLLYSHANLPISMAEMFDDGMCLVVFSLFETVRLCVVDHQMP